MKKDKTVSHKKITEDFREFLNEEESIISQLGYPIALVTTHFAASKKAKELYPPLPKGKRPKKEKNFIAWRDYGDLSYKREAFQHILACFILQHKFKRLNVNKLGRDLESLQKKSKTTLGGSWSKEDHDRDIKNNSIGIKLAYDHKKHKLSKEDYIQIVKYVIEDGEFYTTSTDSSGNLRTYNELQDSDLADRKKYRDMKQQNFNTDKQR